MNATKNVLTEAVAERAETAEGAVPEYRAPARFPVGEAVELLRRDGTGHLRDGTGGWYVWGS